MIGASQPPSFVDPLHYLTWKELSAQFSSAATRSVAKAHETPGTPSPRTSGGQRSGERVG